VRGFGAYQYEIVDGVKTYNGERGAKIMDFVGDWIADAMNFAWDHNDSGRWKRIAAEIGERRDRQAANETQGSVNNGSKG